MTDRGTQTPGTPVSIGERAAGAPGTNPPLLVIAVRGIPGAKGSKNRGKHSVYESSKAVAPWSEAVRSDVVTAVQWREKHLVDGLLAFFPAEGPISIEITFTVRKPVGAPKRKVSWPTKRPDIDKYIRSTLDGITAAGAWHDDAQVVELVSRKVYPEEGVDALPTPGAVIRVWTLGEAA